MNTFLDNLGNGTANNLTQPFAFLDNYPQADLTDGIPPVGLALASGGEKCYSVKIADPDDHTIQICADIYGKMFFKPLKIFVGEPTTEYRVEIVAWNKPNEIITGRGYTAQEALNKAIAKVFKENVEEV